MDRRDMITAPEHLGIINGKLTIGTPGGQAAGIDGLWAPPFVSSDFTLRLEIFGKEIPTPIFKWWPFKLEQRGEVNGVAVSAATVLVPGRRAGLVAITLHNPTRTRSRRRWRSKPAARWIPRAMGVCPGPKLDCHHAHRRKQHADADGRRTVHRSAGCRRRPDVGCRQPRRHADRSAAARRNRHGLSGLRHRSVGQGCGWLPSHCRRAGQGHCRRGRRARPGGGGLVSAASSARLRQSGGGEVL